jgi:hypothetical protein
LRNGTANWKRRVNNELSAVKTTATGVDRMPQKTFPAGLLSGQDVNDNHEPLNLGQGEMRML